MRPPAYDLAVLIGRFQPFLDDHLSAVRAGLHQARRLLIILEGEGSARRPDRAPFTVSERSEMILASLDEDAKARVTISAVPDLIDPDEWRAALSRAAEGALQAAGQGQGGRVLLVAAPEACAGGAAEPPQPWDRPLVLPASPSGAAFRRAYFAEDPASVQAFLRGPALTQAPRAVADWLERFRGGPEYGELVQEQAFADRYRASWNAAPYPPVFVTADAAVIWGEHVLLIQRKARPGKGLWALPGGFLEQDEFVLDAAIRELGEETGLAVPAAELRRRVAAARVFDAPWRDIRGRMVTHAFLFRLEDDGGPPPAVEGGDDAAEAVWVLQGDLRRDQFFGDHYEVLRALLRMAPARAL